MVKSKFDLRDELNVLCCVKMLEKHDADRGSLVNFGHSFVPDHESFLLQVRSDVWMISDGADEHGSAEVCIDEY